MQDVPYPSRGLTRAQRCRIYRLLLLGWSPHAIAEDCHIGLSTAYSQLNKLYRYRSFRVPVLHKLGHPRKLTVADEDMVLEQLLEIGWMQQEEIRYWLWCERGILVHQSTISRLLKKKGWTRKKLRWISLGRSDELRRAWREEMRQFIAEDLVFLDESIFNEKTGWRYHAYGPIGQDT